LISQSIEKNLGRNARASRMARIFMKSRRDFDARPLAPLPPELEAPLDAWIGVLHHSRRRRRHGIREVNQWRQRPTRAFSIKPACARKPGVVAET